MPAGIPGKNDEIDNSEITEACEEYLLFLTSEQYNEDRLIDYENNIFEKALEAVYGEDVWDFVNEQMD
jgi:hypothetical protein